MRGNETLFDGILSPWQPRRATGNRDVVCPGGKGEATKALDRGPLSTAHVQHRTVR